jgi:hypothetical protein
MLHFRNLAWLALASALLVSNPAVGQRPEELPQGAIRSFNFPTLTGAERLSYSPDGTKLLTGSLGNMACIWSIKTGERFATL